MVMFTCVGTTKEISMPLYNTGPHIVQWLLWVLWHDSKSGSEVCGFAQNRDLTKMFTG
jgi:hypothetical protein